MDIIEFATNYTRFYNPIKGWSTGVSLLQYEKEFLENLIEHKRTLNLASRQMNMTTLLSIYSAYVLLFGNGERISYISPKLESSTQFIQKVKVIIESYLIATDNRLVYDKDTKRNIILKGNSLMVHSTSIDSFRGYSTTKVLVDNATHIRGFEEIYARIIPTSSIGGSIHMISQCTPYFHDLFYGENEYKKFKYHYSLNPNRFTPLMIEDIKKRIFSEELWQIEMELECTKPKIKHKDKTILVRVDDLTYNKIGNRLIEQNISVSTYIRGLIEKDLSN